MRRAMLGIGALALVGLGALGSRDRVQPVTGVGVAAAASVAVQAPGPRFETAAALEQYYVELEKTAQEHGARGDEVARAIAAYRASRATVGDGDAGKALRRHATRLHRLERQQKLAPSMARLSALAADLKREENPQVRAHLAAEYRETAARLPPVEKLVAMKALEP